MTTHRIEITQRHLDNAVPVPMGQQAIIDALRDAGMTETWIKGNRCAMTHPGWTRRYYSRSTRLDGWQLERMRNPGPGPALRPGPGRSPQRRLDGGGAHPQFQRVAEQRRRPG